MTSGRKGSLGLLLLRLLLPLTERGGGCYIDIFPAFAFLCSSCYITNFSSCLAPIWSGKHIWAVNSIDASLREKTGFKADWLTLPILILCGSWCSHPRLCHSQAPLSVMHSTLLSIRKAGREWLTLCSIMSEITNTPLTLGIKARAQTTLPVRFGGLGVRSAAVLAPAAYLSSSAATADLVDAIQLPPIYPPISASPLLRHCHTSLVPRSWQW